MKLKHEFMEKGIDLLLRIHLIVRKKLKIVTQI